MQMATGDQIRQARVAAGLTQTELARLSGVRQSNIAAYENGRRRPSAAMVARLLAGTRQRPSALVNRHRSAIRQIGSAHKARELRVFGSVAEGTDTVHSDLDVLVTFEPGASLFDLAALTEELRKLLGIPVDVVSAGGLKERDQHIRASSVPV